jgi:hypothetical protein
LEALDKVRESYLAERPYRIVSELNPQRLEYVARVHATNDPPKPLGTLPDVSGISISPTAGRGVMTISVAAGRSPSTCRPEF